MSKPNDTDKRSAKVLKRVTKKKCSGYLSHCALNLKRIARLFDKDRKEVLRALQRSSKKCKAVSNASKAKDQSKDGSLSGESQPSVNNDWQNWLVLHGNAKVMSEDVCDVGKAIGLKFNGDKNNMFDVLSGVGRKNDGGGRNGN